MSITEGQRKISLRRRIEAYCEQHGIRIPEEFHRSDTVYAIAVIDESVPQNPRLLGETFYSSAATLRWFVDKNRHPSNHKVLDFKRGIELVLANEPTLVQGVPFDNRRDTDTQY